MHSIRFNSFLSKSSSQKDISKSSTGKNSFNSKKECVKCDEIASVDKVEKILNPCPPNNISKSDYLIWEAWTFKTNRDVVREAASKGFVQLAIQFISRRNNYEIDQATEYIHNEVLLWIEDLLKGNMICRASKILENSGLEPFDQLQNMFYRTTDENRREYIGNHLKSKEALPNHFEKLWTLLRIIINNKLLTYQDGLLEDSISSLDQKSQVWRDQMAVKLFLSTNSSQLIPLIEREELWNQLLSTKNIEFIKMWITLIYEPNSSMLNLPEKTALLLKSLPITEKMLENLSNSDLSQEQLDEILNELSKYGLFSEKDKTNLLKVLDRINNSNNLTGIFTILKKQPSNLNTESFIKLLANYCLENNLLIVLNTCFSDCDLAKNFENNSSPELELMMNFRELILNFNTTNLLDNIFSVANYLSPNNLEQHFCDNPMILLTLLILNENVSLEKTMKLKFLNLYKLDFYPFLYTILEKFPIFYNIYNRKINNVNSTVTYLDLVEKHLQIDVKTVYSFHFNETVVPNFNSPELKIGVYSKKVNFKFFIRQCKPYVAAKHFYIDLLRNDKKIDDVSKDTAYKKVCKIALNNFQNTAVTVSCVTFLEIIGMSSRSLRINIKIAKILIENGANFHTITELFLTLRDFNLIQKLLDETIVNKFINFDSLIKSGTEFVKAVQLYEIVIEFSKMLRGPLPDNFLKQLGQRNLWFQFLLYAQMKNYPEEQLKELCSHFKNPTLLEHVIHSIMYNIRADESNISAEDKDVRGYFLSKLGVRKNLSESSSSGSMSGSMTGSFIAGNLEIIEIDLNNTKATLLQILIRCHNSTDPPKALLEAAQLYRNPLLCIFATSYEPDSVITNWLAWLAISTNMYELFSNFGSIALSSLEVADLLNRCMKNKFPKTLFESCVIFVPDSPLTPLCDFLHALLQRNYDAEYLIPIVEKFKIRMTNRRTSILSLNDYELTYLKNKSWLETTAKKLLCSALIFNTKSLFDQIKIVELMCDLNIESIFSTCEFPDFHHLKMVLNLVFDKKLKFNIEEYLDTSRKEHSIQNCINQLIELNFFNEALKVSESINLDIFSIILKKWNKTFKSAPEKSKELFLDCYKDFEINQVPSELAISFFKSLTNLNNLERYYSVKFSHIWAKTHDLSNKYQLEYEEILACIKVEDEEGNFEELDYGNAKENSITYKEMVDIIQEIVPLMDEKLDCETLNKIEGILNKELDNSNIFLALKLEKMFKINSNDLDLIKIIFQLAEGLILPHQLNEEQQNLVTKVKGLHLVGNEKNIFRSKSIVLEYPKETTELTKYTTINMIQSLMEKVNHGSNLAFNVFLKYRISCNMDVSYDFVITHPDPFEMLKNALEEDCLNKLEMVDDFFEVFNWTHEEITNFLWAEFYEAATIYSKSQIETFAMWDIKVVDQFHLVLKLIKKECSTLGYKLYSSANAIYQQQMMANLNFKISEMCLVVELLIASHNCFTHDCNMEGISIILRKCREVINHLLNVRSWKLIVRLLIGIGRYTELNFIFDILRQNDQFEFLLTRSSNRDDRLKVACMEYLKKYCPQNKELYKQVAIHFNLYSEIAQIWEKEAAEIINNLTEIAVAEMENCNSNIAGKPIEFIVLTKSKETFILLDLALDKYVMAAEFHMEGEKFAKAVNAVNQSELIALQKSLFLNVEMDKTVSCLLNLIESKVLKYMSNELNLAQSLLLAQAYNYIPDWAQIVYTQVIVNNNIQYFIDYVQSFGVSGEIIEDVARKFMKNQSASGAQYANMRKIVEKLETLDLKYRLASEMGFTRLAAEIVNSENVFYLKDTVWKSGFKGNCSQHSD